MEYQEEYRSKSSDVASSIKEITKIKVDNTEYMVRLLPKVQMSRAMSEKDKVSEIEIMELLLSTIMEPKGLTIDDFDSVKELEDLCNEILKVNFPTLSIFQKSIS